MQTLTKVDVEPVVTIPIVHVKKESVEVVVHTKQ